ALFSQPNKFGGYTIELDMTTLRNNKFFQCPESNRLVFFWLFCFAVLFSLVLIANPGFFSHSEIEKADYIHQLGLALTLGKDMPFVSSFLEGMMSHFSFKYPFWVHLMTVLIHGAVACLLFSAIVRVQGNRRFAWASALIFLACPLVTFSTAWAGATSELLYVLFGLVAFNSAHDYITEKRRGSALLATFFASLLAMVCKQTAIVFPLVLLLIFYFFPAEKAEKKRIWMAFFAFSIPVLLYLMYRMLPMNVGTQAASHPGLAEGLFVPFIYPFLPFLTESHTWVLQSSLNIGAAVVMFVVLLFLLWRAFSIKAVLAYLLLCLVFILPAMFTSDAGAHNLYGLGIPFSLAFGALLTVNREETSKAMRFIAIVLLAVSFFHTLVIQHYFYKTGSCMNSIAITTSSAYLADGNPEKMSILVQPNAPGYVLKRFIHERKTIAPGSPVEFEVVDWDKRNEVKTGYVLNCYCQVHEHPDLRLKVSKWGPQDMVANTNPNPQPDGTVGTWIQVSGTENLGELEVLLAGQLAKLTSVQPQMITATFTPDHFAQAGDKEFAIRQVSTGKVFVVGTVHISPSR
ncbi:MAG: hypothetical protein AAB316_06055, partial [Bacteroidota bacterium]